MPSVGLAGGVLLLFWLMSHRVAVVRDSGISWFLGFVAYVAIAMFCIYYGAMALIWMKRRLLWRVRRRLLITYLFVGLTPIVLLGLLGALTWLGVSSGTMSHVVSSQLRRSENNVSDVSASLMSEYEGFKETDDAKIRQWLDERMRFLQRQYPGISISLWRNDERQTKHGSNPITSSPAETDETRQFGSTPSATPQELPEWTRERKDWSGLAVLPAAPDGGSAFVTPFLRAFRRSMAGGKDVAILVSQPVNRALISQIQTATGIRLHPFFVDDRVILGDRSSNIEIRNSEQSDSGVAPTGKSSRRSADPSLTRLDQLGEPLNQNMFPLLIASTNWQTGAQSERLGFMFDWSFSDATHYLIEQGTIGNFFTRILIIVSLIFLVFEFLALLSAAWMTRAVTGTVHRLYKATSFINKGDFSHRVKVRSHDQLGELADAFNEMSSNIESLLEERVEKERLQREIEIAAEVQARLFPESVPQLSGVNISAECRAARGVAGDYYDYVEIAPGLVVIALGDVSGKGLSASLVMSNLQAALRAQSAIMGYKLKEKDAMAAAVNSPTSAGSLSLSGRDEAQLRGLVSAMAASINRQLCQSTDTNRFATMFLGLYDDTSRIMHYTNAGHNLPLLVRADGNVERLSTGGMMVGAFDWATYEEDAIRLLPGDTLTIFSDGLTEAENPRGEEFGEVRLSRLVAEQSFSSPADLCQTVFASVEHWSGSTERADDQTLVIVQSH